VEQAVIADFIKEIAVGFRSAKSYPPGHPVMEKVISNTMAQLEKLQTELPEFSIYFLEQTVIFQDLRFDMTKNPAVKVLLDALRKIELDSMTFQQGILPNDIKNLYDVISTPRMKVKQYGDAGAMLESKGTVNIKINAVKFGIQKGGAVQVMDKKAKEKKDEKEIIDAIMNLKRFVERAGPFAETKKRFKEVVGDIEGTPEVSWDTYSKAVEEIIDLLPAGEQVEVFQGTEVKPFLVRLLSKFDSDFLVNLILNWVESKNQANINRLIKGMDESKFVKLMPVLKEKMPNIVEHLAQAGVKLLLSDKMSSIVSEDDLRMSIKPYFAMLDSQNANIREEALKSLMALANRFIVQGSYDMAKDIVLRVHYAIDQESVNEVIDRLIDDLLRLITTSKEHGHEEFCGQLIQPFNTILSREGLTQEFKKKIIKLLSETGNPSVLPTLFSFLWESGIYPDVRAAIIKFGKDAVDQALITLKEVEDYNIRMRLVDILQNIGDEAIELLLKHLDTPEWYLRRNILTVFGAVGKKDIVDRLKPLLLDDDYRVRLELTKTFANLDYTEGLLKALEDSSFEVKAEALRGLKKKISAEKLVEFLPSFKETGDEIYIEVLKIIDDKKIFDAAQWVADILISLESRNDTVARDIKELGITTLAKLQTPDIKRILEDIKLSKDRILSNLATAALKRIA